MGLGSPVAYLKAVIGLDTKPLEAGIAKSAGLLSKTGPLAVATLGAGALLAGVGVVATKMAGDFQAGITSLATGAGESQKNLKLVSDGIIQLAKDTGTSTKQLIDGMYMIESGGFHGAAGLAILKAAAEGAKVGSADLGTVADSVDTILKNFGEGGALTATQATNALITTVANGKVHLEALAESLAFVLPAGSAAGLGLNDVLGAMATLTSVGIPAAESATYLRQTIIALEAPSQGAKDALAAIGISADMLAQRLKEGLPNTLDLIENKLAEHGIKRGTAQYVAAIREISGGTRQMQGMLNLMGPHLATFAQDVLTIGDASSATGNQVKGWELTQKTFNVQIARAGEVVKTLMIQLGEKLLPVATKLFSWIADNAIPALKNFKDFVTGNSVGSVAFRIALAALAGVIAVNLVMAFGAWAASASAALIPTVALLWPVYAIAAALGILVAGLVWAYNNIKPFHDALDALVKKIGGWGNVIKLAIAVALGPIGLLIGLVALVISHWQQLAPIFQRIGSVIGGFLKPVADTIRAQIKPVLEQLGITLRQQLLPAWQSLQHAFEAAKPVLAILAAALAIIGGVIGVVLIANIGILVGVLTGLANALGPIISGLAIVFGGLVRIVSGFIQVVVGIVGGFVRVLIDLFSGRFDKIGQDFLAIWENIKAGVGNILGGLWDVVRGWFTVLVGGVLGYVSGFIGGVIGFFQHLFDTLVGHSIIPDLVNGILGWVERLAINALAKFLYLKQQAIKHLQEMATGIINAITALPGQMLALGEQIAKALGDGIRNAAHFVHDAIKSLPIPGVAGVQQFMDSHVPHFAEGGLMASTGLAIVGEQGPETVILPGGARVIPQSRGGGGSGGGSYGGGNGGPIVVQLIVDGRKLAEVTAQHLPHVIRTATGNRRI